jgi:hypothetical protein
MILISRTKLLNLGKDWLRNHDLVAIFWKSSMLIYICTFVSLFPEGMSRNCLLTDTIFQASITHISMAKLFYVEKD